MLSKKAILGTISCAMILSLSLTACNNDDNDKAKETKEETVKLSSISTEDAQKYAADDNYVFVDTRNDSYYNGFKQEGVSKGGHIEGAVQYTADWVGKVNKDKLSKFVEDKGIDKNKKIVVYDTESENINKVGKELKDLGYDVLAYDKLDEYSKNDQNKMNSFPRYEQLVNAQWVKDLTDGKTPETLKNKDYMIFEVSWGPEDQAKDYKKSYIKGSYHFNTDWIENGPDWNLSKPEVIKKNLENAGISKDKTIVLYSNDASAAARVMFALKWSGVEDVRILNGGLEAWQQEKYPTEEKVNIPKKVEDFGTQIPANPQIDIATPKEAIEKMGSEKLKLISIRSWEEYIGKVSGYDYIPRAGEPKGAIWGFAGSDASSMQDYYDPDGTFRNPLEMAKLWEKQGIYKDDQGAFYCGTGWRAAVPWEMTQMMGWDNFVLFDGGWNMWQMDKELPVQIGAPNNMKKTDSANDFK
ncbi:MAG: rhodanese-like domain-containing protein [Peptostreptococcus sp.]|uniref:rhodanese-like domain-containing protein n=1 Tax=Peptostreptococcus sp. TaxID=1262 RepID=UPI002FC8E2CE